MSDTLAKALLAAQADMPAVERDGLNPHFNSRFVTLGNLIAKVRPVLNAHGIVFAQFPSYDEGHKQTLTTILMHESGERLEYTAELILTKADPQAQGSAITYMRRYALAAALGISDQEDDDGNAASAEPVDEAMGFSPGQDGKHKQRTYFESLLNGRGIAPDDVKRISAFANETLTRKRISAAIDALKDEEKREATASYLFDEMVAWEAKQASLPVDDADLAPVEKESRT